VRTVISIMLTLFGVVTFIVAEFVLVFVFCLLPEDRKILQHVLVCGMMGMIFVYFLHIKWVWSRDGSIVKTPDSAALEGSESMRLTR